MLLETDGSCKLSPEEFDQLLGRAERARDLLAGAVALLREHGIAATAADLLATTRNVVHAIVHECEDAQARAYEARRVHSQALKSVAPAPTR